jgi:Domain of unknown function (DUF4124)
MTFGLAALILLSGTGSAVAGTMYRWVDDQGVVHYSDTPQPGAQRMQMDSAQTYKAPPVQSSSRAITAGPAAASPASAYQSCRISQPAAEQSFFAPESISVIVSLEPGLQRGDALVVTVDGVPLKVGTDGTGFRLTDPGRGSHTVNAAVQGADGKATCTAEPVTFNVERPSLLSPQSPARGH